MYHLFDFGRLSVLNRKVRRVFRKVCKEKRLKFNVKR